MSDTDTLINWEPDTVVVKETKCTFQDCPRVALYQAMLDIPCAKHPIYACLAHKAWATEEQAKELTNWRCGVCGQYMGMIARWGRIR